MMTMTVAASFYYWISGTQSEAMGTTEVFTEDLTLEFCCLIGKSKFKQALEDDNSYAAGLLLGIFCLYILDGS